MTTPRYKVLQESVGEGGFGTLAESAGQAFWSPDGWIYFRGESFAISRVLATGGPIETVRELSEGELGHGFPQTLPSGDALLFQVWHAIGGSDAEIRSIDLETGEQKTLIAGNTPRYVASGHLLFGTTDGTLMAAPFDADRVELTGNAVPVVEGLMNDPPVFTANFQKWLAAIGSPSIGNRMTFTGMPTGSKSRESRKKRSL